MGTKSGTSAPRPGKTHKKLAAATAEVEELTTQVRALRARVRTLEAEADMWRKRARKQRSRARKIRDEAEKAVAAASEAARRRAGKKAGKQLRHTIADHPRAEPLALRDAPPLPQATWTVAQLRAAARDQGVVGCSRMRKEQLLAALV
ncbi:MAG: hypothetical protein JWQ91_756 [Aeromicrobium sp.]|jgi:chromosome segregation ATPase|uniref:hypothetical protein n=1 Tax=Aeromicrobium sp. TaxID=1871063 RepID=UPI0026361580|nr:hypothetical protein [Aeromicrobium sp.]MCW2787849.1 hypothetical protein [Aeromicrobium sp.]MCW2823839.1 hypothetical protein [Aeromicrobium sp.]